MLPWRHNVTAFITLDLYSQWGGKVSQVFVFDQRPRTLPWPRLKLATIGVHELLAREEIGRAR